MSDGDAADWGHVVAKLDAAISTLEAFDYESVGLDPPANLGPIRARRALADMIREEMRSGKTEAEAVAALRAMGHDETIDAFMKRL